MGLRCSLSGAIARPDQCKTLAALYCALKEGEGVSASAGRRAPAGRLAHFPKWSFSTATWPNWGGAGLRPLTPSPPARRLPLAEHTGKPGRWCRQEKDRLRD